jgi:hypothetical protein
LSEKERLFVRAIMAIQSKGEYASVESLDKKSSARVHSDAYQNTTEVAEITNGAPVTNELSIEDAIGTRLADFPPKHKMMRSDTHLSTT